MNFQLLKFILLAVSCLVLVYPQLTMAANIYTVAGGGAGDGRAATEAQISLPSDVTADMAGNLWIADRFNHRIRKVDVTTGIISTVAGSGLSGYSGDGDLAVRARLNSPYGIVVDPHGNVYISDYLNNRIRRIDGLTGRITTIAGNGTATFSGDGGPATLAGLNAPASVALDRTGSLYFSDSNNNRIRKIDLVTGVITTVAGGGNSGLGDGGPAVSAQLYTPRGLAVDDSGNLFIADSGSHRIRKLEKSTGIISTYAGRGTAGFSGDNGPATAASLNNPSGLTYRGGVLYIADTGNNRIRNIVSGIISTIVDTKLNGPAGLYAAGGNLYIADTNNNRIRRVDLASGIIFDSAGNGTMYYAGDGGSAGQARLYSPGGMAFDSFGNLYIADRSNHMVRRVDAVTGTITTIAGTGVKGYSGDGGPATQANLNTPFDLVFDANRNLYISDQGNHRIRRVDAVTGIITTMAGTGVGGLSGDGGPATNAALNNPSGLAIDTAGNIYVADRMNHRIRKIDLLSGFISTAAGSTPSGFGGSFTGDSGQATLATLNRPLGVSTDSAGNLYIADTENNRIRKVNSVTGIINTVAGGGSPILDDGNLATNVTLIAPPDVASDPSGSFFYIADPGSTRVRKVDADGIISTAAGTNGSMGFSGDGGPALTARLNGPVALAPDETGTLFIADSQNNRIRKVTAVNQTPLFHTTGNITVHEGTTDVMQVWTEGPEATDIISLSAISLPAFATLTDNGNGTGIVTVSPGKNSSGSYSGITLVSTDGAQSASHPLVITVTVPSVSVSLSSSVWNIGVIQAGQTLQMTEYDDITITNDGPVAEIFTLRLSDPPGWTAGNMAGQDIYVMKGLFVRSGDSMSLPPGDVPSDTDFGADDVISTTPSTASAGVFGYAGGSMTGTGVLPWNSVDLWLQFTSPAGSSIYGSQQIEVTVGAVPY